MENRNIAAGRAGDGQTGERVAHDLRRLQAIEAEAREGRKLGNQDRLLAAWHLTQAWRKANEAGLRKEEYQDQVLAALTRPHAKRQEFRLSNWTLKRGVDPRAADLRAKSAESPTPQRALEPYLAGITVAARHCGFDAGEWKLDLLRDLSLWNRRDTTPELQPVDDRPAETLAMLITAMCAALGRRNKLQDVFDVLPGLSCRWEMFGEKLVATDPACFVEGPELNKVDQSYFEEMFPIPSVSLIRVPYLSHNTRFVLAPEAGLGAAVDDADARYANTFAAAGVQQVSADAQGRMELDGHFGWYRDIRLCILSDGRGGYVAALESRPHVEVSFAGDGPLAGTHHIQAGFEPDFSRPLFYARDEHGAPVWPHLVDAEGSRWRISHPVSPEGIVDGPVIRDPETTGWQFDPDPLGAPGEFWAEPWYLSYCPATPDYLRHWLTGDWQLGDLPAVTGWNRGNFSDWDDPESRWGRDLPPIGEMSFPDQTAATWVECCLHNGLLEEALQAAIDRLKTQAAALQSARQAARDRHAEALLARWHISNDRKEPR